MKGAWLFDGVVWHCSRCDENPTKGMGYVQSINNLFNFCPWCGSENSTCNTNEAKMRTIPYKE